ncbi:MAG: hypothetical protein R3B82_16170 [Sandaracinaceae bacterium]
MFNPSISLRRVVAVAALGLLVACGGSPTEPEPIAGGLVMGTVTDLSGVGLDGVDVTIGGLATQSNGQGWFTVAGVPAAERAVIRASDDGWIAAVDTIAVRDGGTTWVEMHLAPVQVTATITPSVGGPITSRAQTVTFPANAFVDEATGAPITEAVEVAMSSFDFTDDSDIDAFPGDFVGRDTTGTEQMLESLGFLDVTLSTASGARVAIAPGASVEIRLDTALTATAPATVPLWYFDETEGIWIEEGVATRVGTALVGTVTHFTAWNYDLRYDACFVNGRVVDELGNPLYWAHVQHTGIDYRGGSGRDTDALGQFSLPVNPSSRVRIWATYRGQRSAPIEVDTAGACVSGVGDIVIPGIAGGVNATFTLSWGVEPTDLDAHLWTPSGAHVYYGSRGALGQAPFAQLNTDDTSSYGPEITTITTLESGTYVYCVHNYSGAPGFDRSNAVVTYADSRGVIQQMRAPASASADWWRVASFDASGGQITGVHFDGSLGTSCP